jgi:hypothetical protein
VRISNSQGRLSDICFIDIETSGSQPEKCEILGLELCVRVDGSADTKQFFFKPKFELDNNALIFLGLKADFLDNQLPLDVLRTEINNQLKSKLIVSLNSDFVSNFLDWNEIGTENQKLDFLSLVRDKLDGCYPYCYDDFTWADWKKSLPSINKKYSSLLENKFSGTLLSEIANDLFSGDLLYFIETLHSFDD